MNPENLIPQIINKIMKISKNKISEVCLKGSSLFITEKFMYMPQCFVFANAAQANAKKGKKYGRKSIITRNCRY